MAENETKENGQLIQSKRRIRLICRAALFEMIRFEWKFPKPEVPPIIQNAVGSSGIRWIQNYKTHVTAWYLVQIPLLLEHSSAFQIKSAFTKYLTLGLYCLTWFEFYSYGTSSICYL